MLSMAEQCSGASGMLAPFFGATAGRVLPEKLSSAPGVTRLVALDYVTLSGTDESPGLGEIPLQLSPGAPAPTSAGVSTSAQFRRQLVEYLERQDLDLSATYDASQTSAAHPRLLDPVAPVVVSTGNGTKVSVTPTELGMRVRLGLPNGRTALVDGISSDVRFSIDERGDILMITREATYTLDAEGNKVASGDGADPLTGGEGNDIILNFSNAAVEGRGGDDVIITYADRATISGGAGNDTVIVAGKFTQSVDISLGDGDDRFEMRESLAANIRIDGGRGNDSLLLGSVAGATDVSITGGEGDDSITIETVFADSATISGGDGNDLLEIGRIRTQDTASRIDGGTGDDRISVRKLYVTTVNSGSGDDVIRIGQAVDSVIDGGDGTNEISVENMFRSLLVNGTGNDTISINSMLASMILSSEMLEADLWKNPAALSEEDGTAASPAAQQEAGRSRRLHNMDMGRSFESLLVESAAVPDLMA